MPGEHLWRHPRVAALTKSTSAFSQNILKRPPGVKADHIKYTLKRARLRYDGIAQGVWVEECDKHRECCSSKTPTNQRSPNSGRITRNTKVVLRRHTSLIFWWTKACLAACIGLLGIASNKTSCQPLQHTHTHTHTHTRARSRTHTSI